MKRRAAALTLLAAAIFCAFTSQLAEAKDGKITIVALGDSLTAGLGLPNDDSFPAQLQAALKARGKDVSVVNAGVRATRRTPPCSGSTGRCRKMRAR